MNPEQENEALQEWRDSAPFWAKHGATIRTMFAPVTAALIEEASIVRGQRVLDVAGGAGEPALTIAEVVGPKGSVTYTDAVPDMVQAAQREAQKRNLTNLEFRQCAADALPFSDSSFNAAVSRLGIMFFPDPLAALREMLRVAMPGGVLSLVVWSKADVNPFSYTVTEVLSHYVPTAQAATPTHDAFRFAESGKLASLVEQTGATNVRERVLEFYIAAPISPEQFWTLRSEISGTLREKLGILSAEQKNQLRDEVLNAVRKFFPNNQMNFPAQMLIVSGNKPG